MVTPLSWDGGVYLSECGCYCLLRTSPETCPSPMNTLSTPSPCLGREPRRQHKGDLHWIHCLVPPGSWLCKMLDCLPRTTWSMLWGEGPGSPHFLQDIKDRCTIYHAWRVQSPASFEPKERKPLCIFLGLHREKFFGPGSVSWRVLWDGPALREQIRSSFWVAMWMAHGTYLGIVPLCPVMEWEDSRMSKYPFRVPSLPCCMRSGPFVDLTLDSWVNSLQDQPVLNPGEM